jgi:hypothetical protein
LTALLAKKFNRNVNYAMERSAVKGMDSAQVVGRIFEREENESRLRTRAGMKSERYSE